MNEVKPKVEIISHTPCPEHVIETALLQCRESVENIEEKRAKKTVEERIRGIFETDPPHLGILEHASATFRVTGVSRAFSHQLVRHRIASYAQMSQRAVPVEKMGICIPPTFDKEDRLNYLALVALSEAVYKKMIGKSIPLEDARFCLLNGVETQVVITMNFRSWIHFLRLRLDKHAQWEIRFVAEEIWSILKGFAPNVFDETRMMYWE